jgi:hypothetical protein
LFSAPNKYAFERFEVYGFAYRNLEIASLASNLHSFLNQPDYLAEHDDLEAYRSELDDEKLVDSLLGGLLDVHMGGGEPIGLGAQTPDGNRSVEFAVLTNFGPVDPVYFYGLKSVIVGGPDSDAPNPAQLGSFVQLTDGPTWPVFNPGASNETLIEETNDEPVPFAVLEAMRGVKSFTAEEWRTVGDNQKSVFTDRLLARTGNWDGDDPPPAFSFDTLDWKHLFQLEAVTEFYANFHEPWAENAEPRDSASLTEPGDGSDPLAGTAASIAGSDNWSTTLDLDAESANLERLLPNVDHIYLVADENRSGRTYRIVEIDADNERVAVRGDVDFGDDAQSEWEIPYTVTVNFLNPAGETATVQDGSNTVQLDDAATEDLRWLRLHQREQVAMPDLLVLQEQPDTITRITDADPETGELTLENSISVDGSGELTSGWEIRRRPIISLVDAFGRRMGGSEATVPDETAPKVVELQGPTANLDRVNANFDTVYFPEDSARGAYRIMDKDTDSDHPTITLHDEPDFDGDESSWYIMSGVGGDLPPMYYVMGDSRENNDGYGGAKTGFSHLDGALFVIKDGTVNRWFRWNSYTSRNYTFGNNSRSSVRGNLRYEFESFQAADSEFQNFNMKVADAFSKYYDHYPRDDTTREAAFYFENSPPQNHAHDEFSEDADVWDTVTADRLGPNQDTDDTDGKTAIRFHWSPHYRGVKNARSAGCITSPSYPGLRLAMIEIYQAEYEALEGTRDGEVERLATDGINQGSAEDLYDENGTNQLWSEYADVGGGAGRRFGKIYGTLWLIRPDQRPVEEQ